VGLPVRTPALSEETHDRVWRCYRDNPEFNIGTCIRIVAHEAGIKENVASARYYGWRKKMHDHCGLPPEAKRPLGAPSPLVSGEYEKELDALIERLQRLRPMMRGADRMVYEQREE
jgi:hypothetical protein